MNRRVTLCLLETIVDGEQLAKYMIDFDIGVSKVATYNVKKIDTDYFTED